MRRPTLALLSVGFILACQPYGQETQPEWQPQENTLRTSWAADVTPTNVHPEYPRPQMVRDRWLNLNGLWDYAITPRESAPPETYDGAILVPFPIESALSGVQKTMNPDQTLWYRRTFELPADWGKQSVMLHFGAVDWQAVVWVNGQKVSEHRGGYTPFSVDITTALADRRRQQEVVVEVWDPTDTGEQPVGKQSLRPQGIWYTATTGIWRTAWLEPVPASYINRLKLIPDVRPIYVIDRGFLQRWGHRHADASDRPGGQAGHSHRRRGSAFAAGPTSGRPETMVAGPSVSLRPSS